MEREHSAWAWVGDRRPVLLASTFFLLGILFAAITPPFQAPDEPEHFARVIALARGELLATKNSEGTGAFFPEGSIADFHLFLRLRFRPDQKISRGELVSALGASRPIADFLRPIPPEKPAEFFPFSNMALYSPFPYLPQIGAVWISAWLGRTFLDAFYFSRLAVLLCSSLLFWWALRRLDRNGRPGAFLTLATLFFLPMWIFQGMSCGADSFLFSLLAALFALTTERKSDRFSGPVLVLLATAIPLCKFVYAPIALLAVLLFFLKEAGEKRFWWAGGATLLCLLPVAGWLWVCQPLYSPLLPGVDPGAQLRYVFDQPWQFLEIVWHSIRQDGHFYRKSMVGILGWADTTFRFNGEFFWLLCGALLALAPKDNAPKSWLSLSLGAVFCGSILVFLSIYLTYNVVAAEGVGGMQGRYFLPLLPFFFWSLRGLLPRFMGERYRRAGFALFLLFFVFIEGKAVAALLKRFWA